MERIRPCAVGLRRNAASRRSGGWRSSTKRPGAAQQGRVFDARSASSDVGRGLGSPGALVLDSIVSTGGLMPSTRAQGNRMSRKRRVVRSLPLKGGGSAPTAFAASHAIALLSGEGAHHPSCTACAFATYSMVMPLALIMAPHCSTSVPTNFCRYSGVRSSGAITVTPAFFSRSTTTGVLRVSVVAA